MLKIYRHQDRKLKAAIKFMTKILEGANKPVGVYTNWSNANLTELGGLPQDNSNLDKHPWSPLWPGLKFEITLITRRSAKCDSMDELLIHSQFRCEAGIRKALTAVVTLTAKAISRIISTWHLKTPPLTIHIWARGSTKACQVNDWEGW